ncbi:MAG TPA: EAL domain-containing protein [Symbiobacteriaceae bacterium]|nr:EAL domain-containing protein [Symbiobacteriaceae bacterium]
MRHTSAQVRDRRRLFATLAAVLAYSAAYPLIGSLGPMGPAFSLIPVAIIGWFWGRWGGLLAAALTVPFHLLMNILLAVPDEGLARSDAPGIAVIFLIGPAAGWVGTLYRQLRAQAASLRESETRLRTIFNQLPALLWTTDQHLVITSGMGARPPGQGLTRESQEVVVGQSIYDLFESNDPAVPAIAAHLGALKGTPGSYQNDLNDHHFECHVEPFHGADGRIVGTIGIALDISLRQRSEEALRRSEERLRDLANHDTLTRLPNRRRFQEELEQRLADAQGTGGRLALLFLDVDGFKYVNDSLGHQAGDDLLKSLADLLRHELQALPHSFIARLGGDEFAILLPGRNQAEACVVAEQIVQATRKRISVVRGRPIVATVSVGIAVYPMHGETGETLLAHADLAMYQSKESGRNGFSMYDPERGRRTESEQKLAWEARIRRALDENRFVLHAQPIHTLVCGSVAHYELLLRMVGDDGELIAPGAFLDVAEKFGLIREIDRWVVTRAIRLSSALKAQGETPQLAVNLSGKAFTDPELLPLIQRELAFTGVDPARLVIEITETALITDLAQASDWVKALRGAGCKFAIDDFGSGYTSFSHLRRLPLDYLKIDGSYIKNLPDDEANQHLVRSMVEMARGLGMQTIAEFVGDDATVGLIRACGVDYGQGFFLGKPAALETWWPAVRI